MILAGNDCGGPASGRRVPPCEELTARRARYGLPARSGIND